MLLNGTDFSVDGDSTFTGDVTASGKLLVGTDTEGAALADNLTVADTAEWNNNIDLVLLITVQYTLVMQPLVLMSIGVKLNTIIILIF